jgi:TonB family protein
VFLLLAGAVLAQTAGASNEDMKQRLARARAYVAVRSYTAAAFELEKIRKESNDPSVQNIALMLLMNCYLENGDYTHTQALLNETFNVLKSSKGASSSSYFTVSGQVVKMARGQMERYKQLGLNVADADMPAEVIAELEKMRGTLELVVGQIKELSDGNKRSAEAFGLLEDVTNTRSAMARDAYDATRWKNEVADARERLANSQNAVVNVVDEPANTNDVAQNNSRISGPQPAAANPGITSKPPVKDNREAAVRELPKENNTSGNQILNNQESLKTRGNAAGDSQQTAAIGDTGEARPAGNNPTPSRSRTNTEKNPPAEKPAADDKDGNSPAASVGSLVEIATKRVQPVYPQMARNMRVAGIVRVDLVLDEQGSVLSAQAQGPDMLKRAAMDAIKQWKFRPVVRDGLPTKASGFINFNFSL